MEDSIKRSDAIKAFVEEANGVNVEKAIKEVDVVIPHNDELVSSADRPQDEVDAVEIYERAEHNLEQGYITIGEFDKRIEPLRHLCYGRPQGEWKRRLVDNGFNADWVCSECGYRVKTDFVSFNYCPNCGARMKGADDETI